MKLNYSNKLIGVDNLGLSNLLTKVKYFNVAELTTSTNIETVLNDLSSCYESDNYDEINDINNQLLQKMYVIRKRRNSNVQTLDKVLNIYSSTAMSIKKDLGNI